MFMVRFRCLGSLAGCWRLQKGAPRLCMHVYQQSKQRSPLRTRFSCCTAGPVRTISRNSTMLSLRKLLVFGAGLDLASWYVGVLRQDRCEPACRSVLRTVHFPDTWGLELTQELNTGWHLC